MIGEIEALPGVECRAIDIKIRDDGSLALLLSRYTGGNWSWWLATMSSWGAELEAVSGRSEG